MRKFLLRSAVLGSLISSGVAVASGGVPVEAASYWECNYSALLCSAGGNTQSECSGALNAAINRAHLDGFLVTQVNSCSYNTQYGDWFGSIYLRRR